MQRRRGSEHYDAWQSCMDLRGGRLLDGSKEMPAANGDTGAVMKGLVWMRLVFWQRIFAKEGPAPNRTLVIDLFQ